ncbi:MAG: VCBS repeat-containing protein [Pyrinomonadaceae bacterium]
MQIQNISYRKRTVTDSMYRSNLTLWSMRIAFGLLAALAVVISAANAHGAQNRRPVFTVYRQAVGFVQSELKAAKIPAETADAISTAVVLVPADYDGDGRMDFGTWNRATATWKIQRSSNNSKTTINFGKASTRNMANQNVPVPADFDGDGIDDLAVWSPSTGEWQILNSSKVKNRAATSLRFGVAGDVPVQADYDGDSKADAAVFRPSENRWYILSSKTGETRTVNFGIAGTDLLVPTDFTGDGKADVAVYRRGTWFVLNSATDETEPFEFGFADALPVPGDYDNDGEIDFAVYRSGTWYIYESSAPRLLTYKFGNETDIPLSSIMAKPSIAGLL